MKTPKNLPFLEPRFRMLRDGQELRFLRLLRVGSGRHQFALFIGFQSDVFLFHVRYSPKIKNMDPITLNISTVSGPPLGANPWPHVSSGPATKLKALQLSSFQKVRRAKQVSRTKNMCTSSEALAELPLARTTNHTH
jgi:hypothetical protein